MRTKCDQRVTWNIFWLFSFLSNYHSTWKTSSQIKSIQEIGMRYVNSDSAKSDDWNIIFNAFVRWKQCSHWVAVDNNITVTYAARDVHCLIYLDRYSINMTTISICSIMSIRMHWLGHRVARTENTTAATPQWERPDAHPEHFAVWGRPAHLELGYI